MNRRTITHALGLFLGLTALATAHVRPTPWTQAAWVPPEAGEPAARLFQAMRVDGEAHSPAEAWPLANNPEAWWVRWKMLHNARRSIDVTYFIVSDDAFGLSFLGLLARKAREGLRIRFMVDSRGSKTLSSGLTGRQGYLKELARFPNVDVRVFNPVSKALLRLPKDLRHAVASNHDKIMVVDDEWVLTGGRNISQEYFAGFADDPKAFRDTDVLLHGHGPAGRAREAFTEEFDLLKNHDVKLDYPGWSPKTYELELARQVMERYLIDGGFYDEAQIGPKLRPLARDLKEQLEKIPSVAGLASKGPLPRTKRFPTLVLDKSSYTHKLRNDISQNLFRLIDSAEHSVIIQNPYIVLTDKMAAALVRAARRGVKIIIHTNSPTSADHLIVQGFFLRDWRRILQKLPGARIFGSKKRPIHAKVMIVDDRVTMIGTYNLDPLSESVNSEVTALIEDSGFAARVRKDIADDIEHSYEYWVKRDADGKVVEEYGPNKLMKGFGGALAKFLAKWDWLKRVI